jgi:hypothetical protein
MAFDVPEPRISETRLRYILRWVAWTIGTTLVWGIVLLLIALTILFFAATEGLLGHPWL